ncbi:N-acetyltransferase [Fulvivirga sp. RKSG066]|uniref:GNAT family N-acetyltransferase n=1 Tax=Fulvivirga aurantia TaxID=2529383 RepID=UPI0012BB66E6|nr:GNAT family N-acetyltransferase [Fulvivirga aurantia]MTI20046.1 N-acetyltransferase [Fulvivirga aurantia]
MSNLEIKHDVDKHLFFVKVKGGNAELKYERHSDQYLDFLGTYVPSESRDLGVGESLVEHALNFAKERGLKVKPTCSFVDSYIKENKQFAELKV